MTPDRTESWTVGVRATDCYIAFPQDAAPGKRRRAVIAIHEIFGVDEHIRDVARRFAAQAYVSVAPNLFTGEIQALLTPANIGLAMQSLSKAPPDLRRNPEKFAAFAAAQPPEHRPILEAFGKVSNPVVQAGFAQDLLGVARHLRGLPK